jgi:hypothetical protein
MSQTHTKTGEGTLVDEVRESPVDKYLMRYRRKALLVLLVIVILLGVWCYFQCAKDEPAKGGSSPGYTALDAAPALEVRSA